ncbi:hypothetical protein [Lichenifustis flavocetrariae]|uniref:Uncharacterized protein n=1 Tax=Lichenifustis flavocetrariae TaxID=2949735 RepID=A0AA41Z2J5_9HYPH|nr:hypothetical protein [Lichenifustis flavocetrariae]MCW6513034.1 hypothetical protein [Lichenifustis flavocetrariae]
MKTNALQILRVAGHAPLELKSRLTKCNASGRFKQLALGIDEADQRDGGSAQLGGDPGDIVERRLGPGIVKRSKSTRMPEKVDLLIVCVDRTDHWSRQIS